MSCQLGRMKNQRGTKIGTGAKKYELVWTQGPPSIRPFLYLLTPVSLQYSLCFDLGHDRRVPCTTIPPSLPTSALKIYPFQEAFSLHFPVPTTLS